jgi:hypothetical protein
MTSLQPAALGSTNFDVILRVLVLSPNGVQCETGTSPGEAFWLPRRGYVQWAEEPEAGKTIHAVVPGWLAGKHRQLAGDDEYERRRAKKMEMKMTDRPEDAGHGALFKNQKQEKSSHPDYRGDITIHGRKFWASGWIKDGKRGKYLSLAFRAADEDQKPAASANGKAQ